MTSADPIYRQLILGSGPAGLTAAIYAGRSNCCPLLIQGALPGGQLTSTTTVDNFPGFPDGIEGPKLMQRMEEQARRFGAQIIDGTVTRVVLDQRPFQVWVDETRYRTQTLIICTGAVPRMLGLENETALIGRGVSVCATCDGFFYKGKDVVVVGGGDTALDETIALARFARQVTLVHRRDTLRGTQVLRDKALTLPNVTVRYQSQVTAIHGDRVAGLTGVELSGADGASENLICDGLFVAIGHIPNTALFAGQLELDTEGHIVTHNGVETSVAGVFAAGDVQDKQFRQAISAAGSGCSAALLAERYLENLGL